MENITVQIEHDASLENIEIVIRLPKNDEETNELYRKISSIVQQSKLKVTDNKGCECFLSKNDILSISTENRHIRIIANDGVYTTKQTLTNLEKQLNEKHFIRISRYEIINSDKIIKFDFTVGGTLRIELEGGMETWASRRYIPMIKKHLSSEEDK